MLSLAILTSVRSCIGLSWLLVLLAWTAVPAQAAPAKIVKVLPHYLDLQGRHTVSPSLYDRDTYQADLRQHPEKRSGMRFDIQWKSPDKKPLKLRVELRGVLDSQPTTMVLDQTITKRGWFEHWAGLTLAGDAYKKFGELTAWRATLWADDQLLSEQKSFLW